MLQLVKKDFYIHKTIWLIMLLGMGIYIFAQVSSLFVGIVFCIVMCAQLLATDDKKATQLLLNSLPFTRKDIVNSQYISAFLCIACIISTITLLHLLVHREMPNHQHLLIIAIISLVVVAIYYPFAYRFSTKYFSYFSLGLFALYFLTIQFFIPNLNDRISGIVSDLSTNVQSIHYVYIFIATFVLYVLSWMLSIRIYSKKVFE